jgi:hypothetical protein
MQALELADEVTVTQYGEEKPLGAGFRDRLRPEIGETELSMIMGDVDADAASILVTRTLSMARTCRKTLVGVLREAGFRVEHSPTKANRLHVSVYAPTDNEGLAVDWGADLALRFNECFTEW